MEVLEVTVVPYGYLSGWLAHCLPYLRKPQELVADRTAIDDVVKGLYDQTSFLVVVVEKDNLVGCLTFCIQNYPLSRYLCITMFGGDTGILDAHGEQIMAYFDSLARQYQCKGIEWIGRMGWRNWARNHGFDPYQVVYKKEME